MTNEQYVELVIVFWRPENWWGLYEPLPPALSLTVTAVASPIKHAATTTILRVITLNILYVSVTNYV
jgi:hypothetical protein